MKPNSLSKMQHLIISLVVLLSGCSWLGIGDVAQPPTRALEQPPQQQSPEPTTTNVSVSGTKSKKPGPTDIQIVWKVPLEPVDSFVIHYGYDATVLDKELRLDANLIERFNHPKHGPVYRFYLTGTDDQRPVYLSISAVKDTFVSKPTEVVVVNP